MTIVALMNDLAYGPLALLTTSISNLSDKDYLVSLTHESHCLSKNAKISGGFKGGPLGALPPPLKLSK